MFPKQPASKEQVMGHLEKARADLPAKPVKAKAAPAAAQAPPAASYAMEEEESERPATAPAKAGGAAKGKAKPGAAKKVSVLKAGKASPFKVAIS